jgi:hypothetical protein
MVGKAAPIVDDGWGMQECSRELIPLLLLGPGRR